MSFLIEFGENLKVETALVQSALFVLRNLVLLDTDSGNKPTDTDGNFLRE